LKPLHHMSKIRISDEFATSSTDFIRVATLEELKTVITFGVNEVLLACADVSFRVLALFASRLSRVLMSAIAG